MMFGLCGVVRPALDAEGTTSRGDDYAGLASVTRDTVSTTNSAVSNVAAHNDGDAVEQFKSTTSRVANHFASLAEAAQRTATAYHTAAVTGSSAQNAMITLNAEASRAYWQGLFRGATPHELGLLIQVTRNQLLTVETDAVNKINTAFSQINLPGKTHISEKDKYGRLDPAIDAKWRQLSDEERKEVLQKMADDYADANGYPRIKITFESIPSDPGTVTWGDYDDFPERLRLNSDHLNDPHLINTVAHEMEHRGQYQGMGFRWPWQDERAGMSRVEAERWKQLDQEHVRQRGGPEYWDHYPPRPIEVGAREAGREFVNNMTYEDFQRYL